MMTDEHEVRSQRESIRSIQISSVRDMLRWAHPEFRAYVYDVLEHPGKYPELEARAHSVLGFEADGMDGLRKAFPSVAARG